MRRLPFQYELLSLEELSRRVSLIMHHLQMTVNFDAFHNDGRLLFLRVFTSWVLPGSFVRLTMGFKRLRPFAIVSIFSFTSFASMTRRLLRKDLVALDQDGRIYDLLVGVPTFV